MRLRYFLAPAVLAAAFLPTADAQQSPLLKIEEQRQAAAMKKVEQAIREAVADAQKLQQAGSTIRAGERLRQAMRLLDDPILKKESTEAWKTQLAAAMTAVDAGKKPELTEAPANPHKVADMARTSSMDFSLLTRSGRTMTVGLPGYFLFSASISLSA